MTFASDFAPHWQARLPCGTRSGQGLLPPALYAVKPQFLAFTVVHGAYTLTVLPPQGRLLVNGTVIETLCIPAALVWSRRAQLQCSSGPLSTFSQPVVGWYWLGLDAPPFRRGFSLYRSGTVLWLP